MDFLTKKILGTVLMPTPLIVIVLALGCLILLFTRCRRTGEFFVLLGTVALLLFSTPFVPNLMLSHLEDQYRPLIKPPRSISTIVVLGGGVRIRANAPPNTQLGAASLSRLLEGIRLYRSIKRQGGFANLFLSGGYAYGKFSTPHTMQNTAVMLGITPGNIMLEPGSKNTFQEALYLKKALGKQRFIVVTSAAHMPRTMLLFKKQGLRPIPAPTQFVAGKKTKSIVRFIPKAINLVNADVAMHEYLGIWWAKLNHRA